MSKLSAVTRTGPWIASRQSSKSPSGLRWDWTYLLLIFDLHFFYFQASINDRDLKKETRRAPKGAAAQLAAQKRRAEQQQQAQDTGKQKKIKLENISDEQFFKKLAENKISNELKHKILSLAHE